MRAAVSIFTSQVRSFALFPQIRTRLALKFLDRSVPYSIESVLTCLLQDYISGMTPIMPQFKRAGCLPFSLQTICGKPQ
jgi:hypothetical protein